MPVVNIHKMASTAAATLKETGAAHALLEVLNVKAEGSGDEHAGDIEASDDTMELGESLAEAFRELHGTDQEGAGAH